MKELKLVTKIILFAIIVLLSFSRCEHNNPTLQLIASPDSLIIFDNDSVRELVITTLGKGKVDYKITHKPEWLDIEAMQGVIDNKLLSLKLTPITQSLNDGIYRAKIFIISNVAGKLDIPVSLSVKMRPEIKLSSTEIVFDAANSHFVLNIENPGKAPLDWRIEDVPSWLIVSNNKLSGYVYPNQKYSIVMRCDRASFDLGVVKSEIVIRSNAQQEITRVPVIMHVPALMHVEFSKKNILFDYSQSKNEIFVKNIGNTSFNWNMNFDDIFSIEPSSGYLQKGDSVKLQLSLTNRSVFQTGTFTIPIYVYNATHRDTLNVSVNNFINTKWILDRNIIDAKYCVATNKILILSSNPYRLSVIDPESKEINSVALAYAPQCLAVDKNGKYVAIGHLGRISYVDLAKMIVESEFITSFDVNYIVITSNKWIYYSNSSSFYAIDVNNRTFFKRTNSMYSNGPLALHPSEKYIYTYPLSTSGYFYKFSISGENIIQLYYKTFSNSFWMSNDGERLYKVNWEVLKLSEIEAEDLFRSTIFNGYKTGSIVSLSDSKSGNKVCLISRPESSNMKLYDYNYLNHQKTFPFESFLVNNSIAGSKLYQGEGHYIFLNTNKNVAYALIKANSGSGLFYEWALQIIDLNK